MVSIIIPCWNALEYTKACHASIMRNRIDFCEIIFIDNGSIDETDRWLIDKRSLCNTYLENIVFKHIKNETNLGFPKACNQGYEASSKDSKYICILNNDTLVTPNWLTWMIKHMDHADIVGPCTNYIIGKQQVRVPIYRNEAELDKVALEFHSKNEGQYEETDLLIGVCLLIKRKVIEDIGLFDERFGMGNFEDNDFCLRAKKAGYKLAIAKDVFIHHTGSQTHIANNVNYQALLEQNRKIFEKKWDIGRE